MIQLKMTKMGFNRGFLGGSLLPDQLTDSSLRAQVIHLYLCQLMKLD